MQHNKLEDYIFIVKNALSLNLCDEVLNEFKNNDEWQDTIVGSGTIEKDIRNCKTIVISYPHVIQKNSEVRHKLDNAIFDSAANCIQEYNAKFPHCKIEEDSGY